MAAAAWFAGGFLSGIIVAMCVVRYMGNNWVPPNWR